MALTALQQAVIVATRARDPQMTGTSKNDIFNLMSRMQTIINANVGDVVSKTTLTVTPRQQTYSISGSLPDACRIIGIRDAFDRDLDPIEWNGLFWLNQKWWRETGPELRSWCVVGRDLLVIRPGLLAPQNVTVLHYPVTAPLTQDGDTFQMPDEGVPLILDTVEALLLAKARDLVDVPTVIKRWQERLKEYREEIR